MRLFATLFLSTVFAEDTLIHMTEQQEIRCLVLQTQCISMFKFPNRCFSKMKLEMAKEQCPSFRTSKYRTSCECGYHEVHQLDNSGEFDPVFIIGVTSCCVMAILLILCLLCCIGNSGANCGMKKDGGTVVVDSS